MLSAQIKHYERVDRLLIPFVKIIQRLENHFENKRNPYLYRIVGMNTSLICIDNTVQIIIIYE